MQQPIVIEAPERIPPDTLMVKCSVELQPIEVLEEQWGALTLEEQVSVIKNDTMYILKEHKKCALRQNNLVDWTANGPAK